MSEIFKKPYKVHMPKSAHAEAEFGPGKPGLLICESCGAVYFKKHWHKNLERLNNSEAQSLKNDKKVKFVTCPADTMIKNGQYEGRVTIKNIPEKYKEQLEDLIRGFCDRAYDRDPLDRLIAMKSAGDDWEVTLTENQIANKLARKIKETFSRVISETRFVGGESDVAEVRVEFEHAG